MTVGNGDIASVLPERADLLFFASGVSNSKEERWSEFVREEQLLCDQDSSQHIVYFSTLSLFYANTPYTRHKRSMEHLIKSKFAKYTIIRIGNIAWGKNPNTLINFLRNQVAKGEQVEIKDTYRYVVDKEEFLYWIGMIPDWPCEMNVPGRRMKVQQIFDELCKTH
jgi:hypothetical protein